MVDHLEVRAVGFATEDRPAVWGSDQVPFGFDHGGAITDGEVESAIGSKDQTMQVVPEKTDADPVSVADAATFVGNTVSIRIAESPDIGNVGKKHILAPRQDTGGHAVEWGGKVLGEHRRDRGFAGALRISEEANALRVGVIARHLIGLEVPLHHCHAVIHRLAGEVLIEPVHDAPDVGDSPPCAETLSDEDSAVISDIESHAVGDIGFSCPEFGLPTRRVSEALDGAFGLVRGGCDRRGFERCLLRPELVLGVSGNREGDGGGSQSNGGQTAAECGGRNRHKVLEGMKDVG